jgi:hypothetical protein
VLINVVQRPMPTSSIRVALRCAQVAAAAAAAAAAASPPAAQGGGRRGVGSWDEAEVCQQVGVLLPSRIYRLQPSSSTESIARVNY